MKKAEVKDVKVRVDLESQSGTSHDPARILVYADDRLVETITADVESQQGADDGYYPCVILKRIEAVEDKAS